MIRNIFLDLDDTILDFQAGERVALQRAFTDFGIDPTEEVIKRYMEINIGFWRALERGEVDKARVLVGRFEVLFDEMQVKADPNLVQDVYEGYLATQHDFLPGGKELLVALKESGKYRIYMATNGIPAVQNPRIKDSGVGEYFDKIFISEHMGFAKPDKRFFDRCFAEIEDFNPEETIMVGDSLSSDIQGGINAGIKTCHFNPRNYPYKSITPDYKITSLDQLIPLIEGIE